jgi:hypothetical protein
MHEALITWLGYLEDCIFAFKFTAAASFGETTRAWRCFFSDVAPFSDISPGRQYPKMD